jgi:hypothetical protein
MLEKLIKKAPKIINTGAAASVRVHFKKGSIVIVGSVGRRFGPGAPDGMPGCPTRLSVF